MAVARRFTALFLALIAAVLNPSLLPLAEANFWQERAQSLAPTFPLSPAPVAKELPHAWPTMTAADRSVLARLPTKDLRLTDYVGNGDQGDLLILIQDIHLHAEAQKHIADALEKLDSAVSVVGLEGAFEALDVSEFHALPAQPLRRAVEDFLNERRLAGGSAAALFASHIRFLGVDNRALYDANVVAYLTARTNAGLVNADLTKRTADLRQARVVLSSGLQRLETLQDDYADGKISLSSFLNAVSAQGPLAPPMVRTFLAAIHDEATIDFPAAERERRGLLEKLMPTLSAKEAAQLVHETRAHAEGVVTLGDFHAFLDTLLARHGVRPERGGPFDAYLRYVEISESLRLPALEKETDVWLQRTKTNLGGTSPPAAPILAQGERLRLLRKLSAFSLTSTEWQRLQTMGGADDGWRAHTLFYALADRRSSAFIETLAAQKPGVRIMVAGGFHTDDMVKRWVTQGGRCAVLSPVVMTIPSDPAGYLNAFEQERTPLDRLFASPVLTLSPAHVQLFDRATRAELMATARFWARTLVTRSKRLVFTESNRQHPAGYQPVGTLPGGIDVLERSSQRSFARGLRHAGTWMASLLPALGVTVGSTWGHGNSQAGLAAAGLSGFFVGSVLGVATLLLTARGSLRERLSGPRLFAVIVLNGALFLMHVHELEALFRSVGNSPEEMAQKKGALVLALPFAAVAALAGRQWASVRDIWHHTLSSVQARALMVGILLADWGLKFTGLVLPKTFSHFHGTSMSDETVFTFHAVWLAVLALSFFRRVPIGLVLVTTGAFANTAEAIAWQTVTDPLPFMLSFVNVADLAMMLGAALLVAEVIIAFGTVMDKTGSVLKLRSAVEALFPPPSLPSVVRPVPFIGSLLIAFFLMALPTALHHRGALPPIKSVMGGLTTVFQSETNGVDPERALEHDLRLAIFASPLTKTAWLRWADNPDRALAIAEDLMSHIPHDRRVRATVDSHQAAEATGAVASMDVGLAQEITRFIGLMTVIKECRAGQANVRTLEHWFDAGPTGLWVEDLMTASFVSRWSHAPTQDADLRSMSIDTLTRLVLVKNTWASAAATEEFAQRDHSVRRHNEEVRERWVERVKTAPASVTARIDELHRGRRLQLPPFGEADDLILRFRSSTADFEVISWALTVLSPEEVAETYFFFEGVARPGEDDVRSKAAHLVRLSEFWNAIRGLDHKRLPMGSVVRAWRANLDFGRALQEPANRPDWMTNPAALARETSALTDDDLTIILDQQPATPPFPAFITEAAALERAARKKLSLPAIKPRGVEGIDGRARRLSQRFAKRKGGPDTATSDLSGVLGSHGWPGNVASVTLAGVMSAGLSMTPSLTPILGPAVAVNLIFAFSPADWRAQSQRLRIVPVSDTLAAAEKLSVDDYLSAALTNFDGRRETLVVVTHGPDVLAQAKAVVAGRRINGVIWANGKELTERDGVPVLDQRRLEQQADVALFLTATSDQAVIVASPLLDVVRGEKLASVVILIARILGDVRAVQVSADLHEKIRQSLRPLIQA